MTQPQQHTGSYYAATVNHVTDFAPLRGSKSADVCIVGAGFTGISTALHLAERGYKVHVVEANRVGWGATGRNGGQMIGGISGEAAIAKRLGRSVEEVFGELRWAGHAIIRDRVQRYGIRCDLKYGYLDVAIKERHLRDIEADCERLSRAGATEEIRVLSKSETREMIGTNAYIGALLNMRNGHLHPLNLCIGEALAAASLGVTICEQSPVVEVRKRAKPVVVTRDGSVTANAVVIAGNVYHDLDPGMRGLLIRVNSFIIATEPLSAEIVAAINPRDLAVCDPNYVLEYFRLSADKRLLFGGRLNYFGEDVRTISSRLRAKMARIYPQLARVRIDYAWRGTIDVTVNRSPQFGRIAPNVFYCQGYSGHGVNVTHLAGRIVADAIAGTLEQFDLFADTRPVRIPGAHRLHRPMVALGMMYYRIKDRL